MLPLNLRNISMKKFLSLVAVALLIVPVYAGEFPDITIKELKEAIAQKKATVIDVNGTESWKKGHIPTAVDFATSKERLAKILPQDKKALVVAYCGGPKCQAYQAAAKEAKKVGLYQYQASLCGHFRLG